MKTHCRPHNTLFSILVVFTFASFSGCDTQSNAVQTPPAAPEINAAVQFQNEANEQELQNIKQAEEKKKLEDEEIQALSLKYNEFTIKEIQETVYLYKTGHMSYTQAKTDIEAIIQTASHWTYTEPDNTFQKGMCYIVAKRAIASSGEIYAPPLISLSQNESLGPIMLFSKHENISANGTPTIQIQLGDQTPENVSYENLEGRPLLIPTKNQYNDILNSDHVCNDT